MLRYFVTINGFSGSNVDVDKFCFACLKAQTMLS